MSPLESALTSLSPSRQALNNMARQALLEGAALERLAEQYRTWAERAAIDVGLMKEVGRARAATRRSRMLPDSDRAADVRTNTFKVVQDAKADHLYYLKLATMYANMAQAKFAKAATLKHWR